MIGACLAAGAIVATPSSVPARAETISVAAKSAQPARVRTHGFWNKRCEAQSTRITVLSEPRHGKVTTGSGTHEIVVARLGATATCAGKRIAGRTVTYRSTPGYTGSDTFSYRVTGPTGSFENTVRVRVN